MSAFDDWVSGETGSYLLTCDPLAGTTTFFDAVAERRVGDTLLVTTARSAERLPASARSAAGVVVDATPRTAEAATNVGSPSDLTGISMPVSEFLQRTDDPTVALDSVSPLLYYAEEAAVFRFLSVLATHISRSDGLGIFALPPAAHSAETFHTVEQVFDGRIELDGSGDGLRVRIGSDADEGRHDTPDGWQAL